LGVRAVDPGLKRFLANSRDYFADTSYFEQNATVGYTLVPVYYYYCFPGYGYGVSYCAWYMYYYSVAYRDYSAFDWTALSTWSIEGSIEEQSLSREQG